MNGRRPSAIALAVTILLVAVTAWYGLEYLGRDSEAHTHQQLAELSKVRACPHPPERKELAESCHRTDSGGVRRLWCRLDGKADEIAVTEITARTGEPGDGYPGTTSLVDGGWREPWKPGRYASSGESWEWPRLLHPVSIIARCPAEKSPDAFVVVETVLVPDVRRELNIVFILALVAGITWTAMQRERQWQLVSIRHDLGNMLQTLLNQVSRRIAAIGDDEARDEISKAVTDNVIDMMLVVGKAEAYRETPRKLALRPLLNRLTEGIGGGSVAVTCSCPVGIAVECWVIPFRRALENLVANATHAASTAEAGWVHVSVEASPEWVTITIENNGNRIPSHLQGTITKGHAPFNQTLLTPAVSAYRVLASFGSFRRK